jgi:hypothetical protein
MGVTLKVCVNSLLILAALATPWQCVAQTASRPPQQKEACTVPVEELEVFQGYLREGISSPQVLVTETIAPDIDVDALNLPLAAKGHGIPPDVRTDFKQKNMSNCQIKPFAGTPNLHFISKRENALIFANASSGWREFHKKYGKLASELSLSRVGFNSEKTLALLHVSSGMGSMAAGGTLYLFERKNGKWVIKTHKQTWAT